MIVLETNVISEPMKVRGDPAVLAWLDRQVPETLYLTAVSLSELLVGIAILPDGKRSVLPFDETAAKVYALLIARSRAIGHNVTVADGQIAAITAAHGFTIATRDTSPFVAAGVPVINPWET